MMNKYLRLLLETLSIMLVIYVLAGAITGIWNPLMWTSQMCWILLAIVIIYVGTYFMSYERYL